MVDTEMLMPSRAQPRRELVHVDAVDGERDDAAPLDAGVVQREAGHRRELRAQRRRELAHTRRDGVDAERERVVDRGAEAEPVGDAVLPALEPAGVVAHLQRVAVRPPRGVHVEERRLERRRAATRRT